MGSRACSSQAEVALRAAGVVDFDEQAAKPLKKRKVEMDGGSVDGDEEDCVDAKKTNCVKEDVKPVLAAPSSKLRILNPDKLSDLESDLGSLDSGKYSPGKFPVPMFSPQMGSPRLVPPPVPCVDSCTFPTPKDKMQKETPLHELIQNGTSEGFEETLEKMSKDEIDACNNQGYSALMSAAAHNSQELALFFCEKLLHKNADVNTVDNDGFSALHWAAAMGNVAAMRALIGRGAHIHCKSTILGDTPLHRASRFGKEECVVALLKEHGASSKLKNKSGESAVDVAGKYCSNRALISRAKAKVLKAFYTTDTKLQTLVLYHEDCLRHRTSNAHQEAPERLTAIYDKLKSGLDPASFQITSNFKPASRQQLSFCHESKYIDFVFELHKKVSLSGKPVPFTPRVQEMNGVEQDKMKSEAGCDTFFSQGSLPAALRAVGAVVNAVDRVILGQNRNAFCLVRPPGHHAGPSGLLQNAVSCGFCIFNAVAVAAQHALHKHPNRVKKIAIVDFDVHHGNGTEAIVRSKFENPESVFFFSIHLYDKPNDIVDGREFYPGSGNHDFPEYNIMNEPLVPLWRMPTCRTRSKRRSKSPTPPTQQIQSAEPTPSSSSSSSSSSVGSAIGTRGRSIRLANASSSPSHPTSSEEANKRSDSSVLDSPTEKNIGSPPESNDGSEHNLEGKQLFGRNAFRESIVRRLLPALREFCPDFIFISAGFDAGKNDIGCSKTEKGKCFSGIDLLPEDYTWVTKEIQKISKECCDGRIVSVLEGGYGQWAREKPSGPGAPRKVVLNRDQLAENALGHVKGLCL